MTEATGGDAVSRPGVVVFLQEDTDGHIRLTCDDVTTEDGATWNKVFHYSSLAFDAKRFRDGTLLPEELANIGLGIVARLAATLGK